jgi:hypothetical protein
LFEVVYMMLSPVAGDEVALRLIGEAGVVELLANEV